MPTVGQNPRYPMKHPKETFSNRLRTVTYCNHDDPQLSVLFSPHGHPSLSQPLSAAPRCSQRHWPSSPPSPPLPSLDHRDAPPKSWRRGLPPETGTIFRVRTTEDIHEAHSHTAAYSLTYHTPTTPTPNAPKLPENPNSPAACVERSPAQMGSANFVWSRASSLKLRRPRL